MNTREFFIDRLAALRQHRDAQAPQDYPTQALSWLLDVTNRIILPAIARMEERQITMTQEMDDLKAQVAKNSEVEASAIVLINGIAARIAAAGTDPAALKALTDELRAKDDELAAAVAANTPPPSPPDQTAA